MIRGKLPNAYTTTKSKFLANQEVAAIISLVGGGYGKNFDISKVRWEKIILLADADPDGSHIDTLLLRLFLLYMPEIITSGKLYRAVPPLFGIKNNRGNKYFATKLDFTKYIQSLFNNKYTFTTIDKRKFTNNEASAFFVKNLDYSHDLIVLSNIFAIDPYLLELVLFYLANQIVIQPISTAGLARKAKEITKDEIISDEEGMDESMLPVIKSSVFSTLPYYMKSSYSIKQLASIVKKQYKFVSVKEQNGCALIEGLVNSKYQYFFINDYFIRSCMNLIMNIMKNDSMYYILNGEKVTLLTLMKTFESLTPNGLTRYKGLGEQNPSQLGESVLRPDSDRTLIRYTLDSVKEEIESLRCIDSTMAVLINTAKITKQDIE